MRRIAICGLMIASLIGAFYASGAPPITPVPKENPVATPDVGVVEHKHAHKSYRKLRGLLAHQAHGAGTSYTPVQIAKAYSFPAPLTTGPQQGIALIELGGGYSQADVTAYFQGLGLPVPPVTFISVDGAINSPDGADGAQGEVMLDICCAGGVTGGKIPMYVVTAPNSDAGFVHAIQWAANDPRITAVSISWGSPEDQWTASGISAMRSAMAQCNAAGKAVYAAAGDNGSGDGESGNHVDFPSSAPECVGCGGTALQQNGLETVWNNGGAGGATGGGVSSLFPIPSFQPASVIPGRGRADPDVAGVADPSTGWIVLIAGQKYVFGGTSAVAPMWAGLHCLLNQNLGSNIGFPLPKFYASPAAFKDVTSGNNGTFTAKVGYDCCTGLGSPNGAALLTALRGGPVVQPPPVTPPPPVNPPPTSGPTPIVKFETKKDFPVGTAFNITIGTGQMKGQLKVDMPPGKYALVKLPDATPNVDPTEIIEIGVYPREAIPNIRPVGYVWQTADFGNGHHR